MHAVPQGAPMIVLRQAGWRPFDVWADTPEIFRKSEPPGRFHGSLYLSMCGSVTPSLKYVPILPGYLEPQIREIPSYLALPGADMEEIS